MMTRNENLLIVASEECAEISQAISKAVRFGMQSCHPNNPTQNNEFNILVEYYQLQAVFEMLMDRGVLGRLGDDVIETIKTNKIGKVTHYEKVSSTLGVLKE